MAFLIDKTFIRILQRHHDRTWVTTSCLAEPRYNSWCYKVSGDSITPMTWICKIKDLSQHISADEPLQRQCQARRSCFVGCAFPHSWLPLLALALLPLGHFLYPTKSPATSSTSPHHIHNVCQGKLRIALPREPSSGYPGSWVS